MKKVLLCFVVLASFSSLSACYLEAVSRLRLHDQKDEIAIYADYKILCNASRAHVQHAWVQDGEQACTQELVNLKVLMKEAIRLRNWNNDLCAKYDNYGILPRELAKNKLKLSEIISNLEQRQGEAFTRVAGYNSTKKL